MWVNKAVINWMTPFQRPLINPAQKPHGFLWWQQPTVACVRYTNIQQRSSILREQFTLQSFTQHFQPCWFLVLPMDVPWDILSLRPLALCTLWRPQKTWMSFYLPRFKPQARADPPPPLPPLGLESGDQSGIKFDDLRPEMFRASVQILGEHRGDGHDAAQWRHSLLYFACAAFSSCRRLQAAGGGAGVVSEPCIQMMGFRSGLRLCVVYSHLTVIPQLDRNLCHLCV